MLGAPTLRLRGDYLAIVTLGFGEIVRIFMNNLDRPVNITNGPKGITGIDPVQRGRLQPRADALAVRLPVPVGVLVLLPVRAVLRCW